MNDENFDREYEAESDKAAAVAQRLQEVEAGMMKQIFPSAADKVELQCASPRPSAAPLPLPHAATLLPQPSLAWVSASALGRLTQRVVPQASYAG